MEEKEKNFFKKVWTSIRDFEGYEEFAAGKLSKSIKYMLMITLIFIAIITITYTYKFNLAMQGIRNYINENIDEISMIDGKLKIEPENEIIISDENNIIPLIIINTSENISEEDYEEKLKAYNIGVLMLSDKAIIKSTALTEMQSMPYSNIFTIDIENKEEALNFISNQNLMTTYVALFVTIFIYLFIVQFASNMVDAVVLGAIGYLFSRVVKLKLRYKATFNIGVHALTLPIILNLLYAVVAAFTGFEIKYFQLMYTSISYIYVAVAILMIKTEIINQRIQIIKLKQIQEESSKEAEDMNEKQEEKKEEDESKKEEKEKEEKNKSGEQPEGSNA